MTATDQSHSRCQPLRDGGRPHMGPDPRRDDYASEAANFNTRWLNSPGRNKHPQPVAEQRTRQPSRQNGYGTLEQKPA